MYYKTNDNVGDRWSIFIDALPCSKLRKTCYKRLVERFLLKEGYVAHRQMVAKKKILCDLPRRYFSSTRIDMGKHFGSDRILFKNELLSRGFRFLAVNRSVYFLTEEDHTMAIFLYLSIFKS